MDVAVVLQGLSIVLVIGLIVLVGAFARQLRRLSSGVRKDREARFERKLRERLARQGFTEVEINAALENREEA